MQARDTSPLRPLPRTHRVRSTVVGVAVVALAVSAFVGFRYLTRGDVSTDVTSCHMRFVPQNLPAGSTGRVNVPGAMAAGSVVKVSLQNNTDRFITVEMQDSDGHRMARTLGRNEPLELEPHESTEETYYASRPCDKLKIKAVTTG